MRQPLKPALKLIRRGGREAIAHFMEICAKAHDDSNPDVLDEWVCLAADVLPAEDKHALILELLNEVFAHCEIGEDIATSDNTATSRTLN